MRQVALGMSLLLVFVIPWENMIEIGGFGALAKATGALVAGFWLFVVLRTGRLRQPRPFHLLAIAFILWNLASVMWSVDVDATLRRSLTWLQLLVLSYILWDLYQGPRALWGGLQTYVLGCWVTLGALFYNFSHGIQEEVRRYAASGFSANHMALLVLLGMPVAWYLTISANQTPAERRLRWVNSLYIPAAAYAIMLSGSRAALLGMLPVAVFVFFSLGRFGLLSRLVVLGVSIGAVAGVVVLAPEESIDRLFGHDFLDRGLRGSTESAGRLAIWREGLGIFSEHPFLGIGTGAYAAAAHQIGKVAHNVFVSVLVELGLVGFSLFVGMLGALGALCLRFSGPSQGLWLSLCAAWLPVALTHNTAHFKVTWLFMGLLVVSAELRGTEPAPVCNEFGLPFEEPSSVT